MRPQIPILASILMKLATADFTLVKLPVSSSPGGKCMDGSQAGFFLREGPNKSLFVINLEGGGICTNKIDCDARVKTPLGSSTEWTDVVSDDAIGGLLDWDCNQNPDFCKATSVNIPYCTGDAHLGTRIESRVETWGYNFDGFLNFVAIVELLVEDYGLGEASYVLFTGRGAGACGVFFNVDWLADRLPYASVKAVPEAGWFFLGDIESQLSTLYPYSAYLNHARNYEYGLEEIYRLWAETSKIWGSWKRFPDKCITDYGEDRYFLCSSVENSYKYIRASVFVVENQYFTGFPMYHHLQRLDVSIVETYIAKLGEVSRTSLAQIDNYDWTNPTKPHPDGLFASSCISYGTPTHIMINGQEWVSIVNDWFFQRNKLLEFHQMTQKCSSRLPCNSNKICHLDVNTSKNPLVSLESNDCRSKLFIEGCLSLTSKRMCIECAMHNRTNIMYHQASCDIMESMISICRESYEEGPSSLSLSDFEKKWLHKLLKSNDGGYTYKNSMFIPKNYTSLSQQELNLSEFKSIEPRKKIGLILGESVIPASVQHFDGSASWFYNYKQNPHEWQGDWADANGVEFVPMISKPWVNNVDGSIKCYFKDYQYKDIPNVPECSQSDVVNGVIDSKLARSNGTTPRYLMGFNEMYTYSGGRNLTPSQAAYYWSLYIQPAALAADLELVSPTTGAKLTGKSRAIVWFSDFLKNCYDRRDEKRNSCDVELITKISIHNYDCRESHWRSWFGDDDSLMTRLLIEELGSYGNEKDWSQYIRSRPLWVTETSCYHEPSELGLSQPSNKESCLRITGKKKLSHGIGSIATIEEVKKIERYAWWTTWNADLKPHYLTYLDGQLTPIGKALLNIGGKEIIDCEFPGERIGARHASCRDDQIVYCQSTGTSMARVGKDFSAVTFIIQVPSAGDYAVNLSHLTAIGMRIFVRVNDNLEMMFKLRPTGNRCSEEGLSSTVPLELKALSKGHNRITFRTDTNHNLLIEWISVVIQDG